MNTAPGHELTSADACFVSHVKECSNCDKYFLCGEGGKLHNLAVNARIKELRAGQ